jgi:two-component system cell cycle response regulator DivK
MVGVIAFDDSLRRRRILIIGDNEQHVCLVTVLLEAYGYEVIQARDGREGIELASQVVPSLIRLDIQLPVMDGFAVARALYRFSMPVWAEEKL